jgi:hypothetical protein
MDQLTGSLRFIPLSAVTQFVAGLSSTGRLKLSQGAWSGDITLRHGEVVAARLGSYETGRTALDGMLLGLTEADFAFADEPVDTSLEPLMPRAELEGYLARLMVERERLHLPADALSCMPTLIDQPGGASDANQVTIQAGALQLIPALMHGHTLDHIAQRRGMARTLRELATLHAGGLARLEAAPVTVQRPVAATTTAAPAPRPLTPPVRPLRPVKTDAERPQPQPRRTGWWEASAALTAVPAAQPRPIDPDRTVLIRPRADADPTVLRPLTPPSPTPPSPTPTGSGRSWRTALVGLFVAPKS